MRQITGEQTTLRLGLDDTVGALKEALRAEWGIEADAQRLLLAQTAVAAAGGDAEAGESKGGLPLEEDEAATLRACGVADGTELLLTLQDAAQGAARRELREAARREAAERAEAERKLAEAERELAAERAELSALRGNAREHRRNALKARVAQGTCHPGRGDPNRLTEPQREFLSREARRECLRGCLCRAMIVVLVVAVLALVALLIYATAGCGGTDCGPQGSCSGYPVGGCTCEDGAHLTTLLGGWTRKNCENVTRLDWLDLSHTSASGDVSGLAPLTQLTSLNLRGTSVSGDVSGLAPLTQLTELNLYDTSVSGDVSGLAPLTELTSLSLWSTSVSGDVSGLAPLTQLTVLYLGSTSVSGDVSGLAPLTRLEYLNLDDTSVCGQRNGYDYGTC